MEKRGADVMMAQQRKELFIFDSEENQTKKKESANKNKSKNLHLKHPNPSDDSPSSRETDQARESSSSEKKSTDYEGGKSDRKLGAHEMGRKFKGVKPLKQVKELFRRAVEYPS